MPTITKNYFVYIDRQYFGEFYVAKKEDQRLSIRGLYESGDDYQAQWQAQGDHRLVQLIDVDTGEKTSYLECSIEAIELDEGYTVIQYKTRHGDSSPRPAKGYEERIHRYKKKEALREAKKTQLPYQFSPVTAEEEYTTYMAFPCGCCICSPNPDPKIDQICKEHQAIAYNEGINE